MPVHLHITPSASAHRPNQTSAASTSTPDHRHRQQTTSRNPANGPTPRPLAQDVLPCQIAGDDSAGIKINSALTRPFFRMRYAQEPQEHKSGRRNEQAGDHINMAARIFGSADGGIIRINLHGDALSKHIRQHTVAIKDILIVLPCMLVSDVKRIGHIFIAAALHTGDLRPLCHRNPFKPTVLVMPMFLHVHTAPIRMNNPKNSDTPNRCLLFAEPLLFSV